MLGKETGSKSLTKRPKNYKWSISYRNVTEGTMTMEVRVYSLNTKELVAFTEVEVELTKATITDLFVFPEHRNKHIAKNIMRVVKKKLRAFENPIYVHAKVYDSQAGGLPQSSLVNFYNKCGFKVEAQFINSALLVM